MSKAASTFQDESRTELGPDAGREGAYAGDGGEMLVEAAHGVKERVQEAARNIGARSKEYMRSVETQVKDRPLLSVGAALALGVLIGLMFRRSKT